MGGYQFIHVECYSLSGARTKAGSRKRCVDDIRAELERFPGACPHVENPNPPTILGSLTPARAVDLIRQRAASAVDAAGRRLRKEALVVVCGVSSWPVKRALVEADKLEQKKYLLWRSDTLNWVKRRYRCDILFVEHTDEPYLHIHFWIIPRLDAGGRLRIGDAHDGHRAAAEAASAEKSRHEQGKAYRAAMRKMQDDYYREVGARHGLTRLGPRRQRLTRQEWMERRRAAQEFAAARDRLDRRSREIAIEEGRKYFDELQAQNRKKLLALAEEYARKDSLIAELSKELHILRSFIQAHGLEPARPSGFAVSR